MWHVRDGVGSRVEPAVKHTDLAADDARWRPILLASEAAFYLGVPRSTFYSWISERRPLVTCVRPDRRTRPSIPFIGLAEAYVVNALRRAGVPMQRIWPAIERLRAEKGIDHALASRRLFTDGAELLWDTSKRDGPETGKDLEVIRNSQRVFTEAIRPYLRHITYDEQDWAVQLRLPRFGEVPVIVDPNRAFGRPLIDVGVGVRVEDVLDMSAAGEPPESVAEAYCLPVAIVREVINRAQKKAA